MPLVDSAYCSRPINIPPHLPLILKQFCKAAIRTQPYDLLKWSSAYFRALAEGIEPPTKIRLEYPLPGTISGLTLGFLKVLLRQFGDYNKLFPLEVILRRWDDLCLDRRDLDLIMIIGKFRHKCQVKKFLAIAVGLLGTTLFDTMLMICELFTLEPDGGSAMIPISLFMELYGYLAGLKCDGSKRDTTKEDPSEFLIVDYPGPTGLQISGDSHKNLEPKAVSLTSQDTDVDVELDCDNSTENTVHDSSTDIGVSKDFQFEGVNDHVLSSGNPIQEVGITVHRSPEADSELQSEENKSIFDEHQHSELEGQHFHKKGTSLPAELSSYYPNIPGIGPRLSSEQLATVAVWMAECARLQGGMIGPRNLRHFQCPPLDHQEALP
ncbi:ropporin-1A [Diachasma alloeum]|uniref:ropporin-1A n=1 Tax=Diachasma alloeum TaxID=454923 RepID=UPI0007381CDF|nr:ropporin-1A [Diachasma alloeum]